jgi:Family of unknown function (DUF6300)
VSLGDQSASQEIEVRVTGEPPACHRCGQQSLLSAVVPHGWANPDGTTIRGTMEVTLCACDHASPAAGPLVTYLLVHETITAETLIECAALIRRWTESITIQSINASKLDEEIRSWRRGDL